MSAKHSYLESIADPHSLVTAIPSGGLFPESLGSALQSYAEDVKEFARLVGSSASSAALLESIRRRGAFSADIRMSHLKLFRRCVSLICDTENTKKISKVSTAQIVANYGHTFKPIELLKQQFATLSSEMVSVLAALLAENDYRGQSGYALTTMFFEWFEFERQDFSIRGPRRAGPDVELSTVFPMFTGSCPCDFVITARETQRVVAVGFARYDATRGGSQSDDRPGGNANKVDKMRDLQNRTGMPFRIIFLADGPGLTHGDTWKEACVLDGSWEDNVRVATLKLAPRRITQDWLTF